MTFVQFGGTSVAQQNDLSAAGFMNGDVYLSTSNNGGTLWSPAVNLTNSLFPGCNPATSPADSCPSENFPSIARTIDDTIHIQYIADRDAGDAVFSQGTWTFNPVMYYRIPGGTNVQPVCPLIAPNFSAELSDANGGECEYNTPPNTTLNETLTLSNVGNAAMTGVVSKTGAFLTVAGMGPYNIPAGGANLTYPVTMAGGATEGLLQGSISITHNDPTKTTPFEIPVDFFVFNDFACPKYVVLHTKWLELEVSNVARVAIGPKLCAEIEGSCDQTGREGTILGVPGGYSNGRLRGLYRAPRFGQADSGNNAIYDGSLIIAKTPNPSAPPPGDTLVYRYIFGQGAGQPGFRALSALTVDTSRYGTGSGVAYARANQTTVDSLIGIDVEYQFPQHTDSSDFAIIKYRIYNRTTSTITGLIVGEAVDFDIVPSTVNAKWQSGLENKAGFNTSMNLLYQQGADSGTTTFAQKYLGGMTAIQCTTAPRAWIAPNDPWLFGRPGGGFSEGYLYSQLVKTGFEILPPTPVPPAKGSDLHSVITFEKNVTLNPTTVKHYVLGFVASTQGPSNTDLIVQTKKAWKFAFGWQEIAVLDTLPESTPASYPYWALGSHENGPASGCCGCVVTKVSGSALLTIVPDAGNCTGTINFAGTATPGTYTATFRVQTPTCAGPQYTEDRVVTILVPSGANPPIIVSTSPPRNALNVAKTTDITATFDTDMNGATINAGTFIVNGSQSGAHSGAISYNNPTRTATFNPATDFAPGELVTVLLTTGVQSSGGMPLGSGYSWSFTVAVTGGSGTFGPAVKIALGANRYPADIVPVDYDHDGDRDIFVLVSDNACNVDSVCIMNNNGSGGMTLCGVHPVGFSGATSGKPASIVGTADFDKNGITDVAVVKSLTDGDYVSILMNIGSGPMDAGTAMLAPMGVHPVGFSGASSGKPAGIVADVDGDGGKDIVVADHTDEGDVRVAVLYNILSGANWISEVYPVGFVGTPVGGPSLGDAEHDASDGEWSLCLVQAFTDGDYLAVFQVNGSGGGTLHAGTAMLAPMGVYPTGFKGSSSGKPASIVADMDGDTLLDVVIVDAFANGDSICIMKNDGHGGFVSSGVYPVRFGGAPAGSPSMAGGDFNGDGFMDCGIADQFPLTGDSALIMLGNGSGGMTLCGINPTTMKGAGTGKPASLVAADMNGDAALNKMTGGGGLDLIYVNFEVCSLAVLFNQPSGCYCPHQGDIASRPTGDGVIDVFDVIEVIGIAFSGGTDPKDPACPTTRGDVDNNGVADVFDVIYLIATAFSGGANPVDPCGP